MHSPDKHQQGDQQAPDQDERGLMFEVVEEEQAEGGRRILSRGIYLLPNAFTTAALFSGFYAIIAAMNGHFEQAAIAIFIAALFDGMDGRIARMTNTQSAFGAEYDSLSDMVSFGVAPALVMFSWSLHSLGKIGWIVSFIYAVAAAFRLARFNVQLAESDGRYFTGLASPTAAAIIASLVWAGVDNHWLRLDRGVAIAAAVVTVAAAFLMVSNFRYLSFKQLDRSRVPFAMMLPLVLVLVAINYDLPMGLLMVSLLYAVSGPVASVVTRMRAPAAS